MICHVCTYMLCEEKGRTWAGTLDHTFEHHKSIASLRKSAQMHCTICASLANALGHDTNSKEEFSRPIEALLRRSTIMDNEVKGVEFILDFDLGGNRERTFVLYGYDSVPHLKRPELRICMSETLLTAQVWMKACSCADFWSQPGKKWYPRRLLDLQELRCSGNNVEHVRIRLIESDDIAWNDTLDSESKSGLYEHANDRYVSLSHCWGVPQKGQQLLRLTFDTEKQFKEERLSLRDLPKTFRDSVVFASLLDRVGYIWIDSLCIRQPLQYPGANEKEQLQDWLEQSRNMDKVYRKAYINISATASSNSTGGLYLDKRPERSWDNDVDVKYSEDYFDMTAMDVVMGPETLTRCAIVDVSAWDDIVEHAPVNQRGWVLQERFMAPRVLHLSHNQIAWECAEFQHAERQPEMNLATRVTPGDVVTQHVLFKDLTEHAGRRFRDARLRGLADPDEQMQDLYIFELWKHVVELYTQTQLTHSRDKLVALSGIAKVFRRELFSGKNKPRYVAGLWSRNLESQLLWQANEVYLDGRYENPAKRNDTGIPSFSWASIDTPLGITYSDVTDYGIYRKHATHSFPDCEGELFIEILKYSVTLVDPRNPFGMVQSGRLLLKPRYLRRIELRRMSGFCGGSYSWRLRNASYDETPREFTNLYLDTPDYVTDLFEDNAKLYCMPAAYLMVREQ